jgi:predicted RNA-binding Zn ribbon-like protein
MSQILYDRYHLEAVLLYRRYIGKACTGVSTVNVIISAIMTETRDAEIHHLIGGELCLDFANTLYGHTKSVHEYLFDFRDLVLWSRHAGALSSEKAEILLSKGEQAPAESEAVFRQAIQIRETIFRVFASLAHDETPLDDDLTRLHQVWLETQSRTRLQQSDTGFVLGWEESDALDGMLWPITRSAMELLTSDDLMRVKQCGRCDWLFLDKSRNRSRRWCSMDACGNRIKMARRYEREKLET